MEPRKFAVVVFVLAIGVIGSIYIIKKSSSRVISGKIPVSASRTNNTGPSKSAFRDNSETSSVADNGTTKIYSSNPPENSSNSPYGGTLTGSLIQSIINGLQEKNKNGLTQENGKPAMLSPNINDVLNNFLSSSSSSVLNDLNPRIDESKIKISNDISQENEIKYLRNIKNVLEKYLGSSNFNINQMILDSLTAVSTQNDIGLTINLADKLNSLVQKVYSISVPIEWLNFHKQFLSYYNSISSSLLMVADFNSDPLKAYFATQNLQHLQQLENGKDKLTEIWNQNIAASGIDPKSI